MRRAPFGVSVDTAELRQALTAVLPHVDKAGTASIAAADFQWVLEGGDTK